MERERIIFDSELERKQRIDDLAEQINIRSEGKTPEEIGADSEIARLVGLIREA